MPSSLPVASVNLQFKVASLQAELSHLQKQYDALLEVKERAARRYKLDYKKWRDFKRWLHDNHRKEEGRMSLADEDRETSSKPSAKEKLRLFEEIGPDLSVFEDEEMPCNVGEVLLSSSKISPTPGAKPHRIDPEVLIVADSPVKPKKQKLGHYDTSNELPLPISADSTISRPDPDAYRDIPSKRPEMTCDGRYGYGPAEPHVLQASKLNAPHQCIAAGQEGPYHHYKGRGRYARAFGGRDTINSRFMIRQDKNDGLAFQYDTVIRNQEQRKGMLAGDCECCRDYYDAIGSLPRRLQQPLWRSPASSPTKGRPCKADVESPEDACLKEDADNVAQHKQEISKHRHHWHRAKTPPGYWNIGFPDTQEASDINHRAEQMHRQKMNLVEKEAGTENGRYVQRHD